MNEELTTVNEENQQKVEELDQLSSDLHNLLNATHIATVFLDRDTRILRLTTGVTESFGIREIDRGRSLAEFTDRMGYEQFREDFAHVLDRLAPVEREVGGERDRCYSARLQPYRSANDRIQGVILTFIDITERKQAEEEIRESRELAEKIIDTVRNPMLVLDEDLRVQSTNESFHERFHMRPTDITGECVFDLHEGQWDNRRLRELLEDVLPENHVVDDFELEHRLGDGQDRSLLLNARRVDHVQLILLAIEDVTEQKQAREALERSHDELERLVAERTAQLERQAVRLRRLVGELASAEQRERARIAAVLHDELQQLLVGAKMRLGTARSQARDEALVPVLEQTLSHLDEAIEATRSLVRQAGSHALVEQGLISALRSLGEEMERRHGLVVSVEAEGPEPPLGEDLRVLLFESIREMLFNVVKHAYVDEASVAVDQDDERLYLTVSDDGVGFDVEQRVGREDRTEFGLFSRGDRLEALGGSCSIDSAPAQGTRIQLSLPFDAVRAD